MRRQSFLRITAALLGSQALSANAAEATLYLMEVPPMTMNEPQRKGIVGDLTLEAMRRAGYVPQLVVEPSNRAMVNAMGQANALIIPLARLPDREANYTWIAPLMRVNRAFFALESPANSFAAAREKYQRVAVSRGTAGVSILLEQGFTRQQIVEVTQGDAAPRILLLGRVDAWYNPVIESQLLLRQLDASGRVHMGAPLGPSFNYLACARQCDALMVERLRAALATMEADGTMQAIRQRYVLPE